MAIVTIAALYCWKKKKLEKAKWVLWGLIISVIFPQIANQTGWMTAEIGRQPWVVMEIAEDRTWGISIDHIPSSADVDHHVHRDLCAAFRAVSFLIGPKDQAWALNEEVCRAGLYRDVLKPSKEE